MRFNTFSLIIHALRFFRSEELLYKLQNKQTNDGEDWNGQFMKLYEIAILEFYTSDVFKVIDSYISDNSINMTVKELFAYLNENYRKVES